MGFSKPVEIGSLGKTPFKLSVLGELNIFNMAKSDSTVVDWLNLHGLDATIVKAVLDRVDVSKRPASCAATPWPEKLSAEKAWSLVSQAFTDLLPDLSGEISFISQHCEKVFDAPSTEAPYTLDRVGKQTPFVSICYRGTPADVLCVAHEFGHALQYHLTDGSFVPPILREVAAFTAEKLLLDFTKTNQLDLYGWLLDSWQNDNLIYLADDVKILRSALKDLSTPYTYRMNYPLARYLIDLKLESLACSEAMAVFRGTFSLSEGILYSTRSEWSCQIENYLPESPEAKVNQPIINAYRSLGMMTLLDIDLRNGKSEDTIGEYYLTQLSHMKAQTSLVVIGQERKPIGYASWELGQDDPSVVYLTRVVAPFGDSVEVEERVRARFPTGIKLCYAT